MRKMNVKRQIKLSIFVRSVLRQGFPEAAVENTQVLAFFMKKTSTFRRIPPMPVTSPHALLL